jgi:PAS domain-containing protein
VTRADRETPPAVARTETEPPELGRALFAEIADALFLIDPESDRVIDVNPAALRLTGFARGELLDTPSEHLFRLFASIPDVLCYEDRGLRFLGGTRRSRPWPGGRSPGCSGGRAPRF